MTLNDLTSIEQLERFLDGSQVCHYEPCSSKDERYQWIQKTLAQFIYITLSKREKGIVIQFLVKISGYSRQQITRLIKQYVATGQCRRKQCTSNGFSRRYTDADIRLLADLDTLHETPCGSVVKKLCERAWTQTGDCRYERLSHISVSHIYNLRNTNTYQTTRRHFSKTQPSKSTIGERRKPDPQGLPGYLRVDTVHQGDQDKQKGVYHVNLVDEQTQMGISFATEKISEQYMLPGLQTAMNRLPFKIRGFHSDNGSEFINRSVSRLLNKLSVEFTKSRARQSNDNGLVESKNGSVIRKHFGYSHIPQHWASQINTSLQEPLYRYQNFHRPCFFAQTVIDSKGKKKKTYPYDKLMTPYESLIAIPEVEQHLKENVHLADLEAYAKAMTDNQAAQDLQKAKQKLFANIFKNSA